MNIKLDKLQFGCQTRVQPDEVTVNEYAARMVEGDQFPDVVAFDDGSSVWLADGFHRILAAQRNGFTDFNCDLRKGTRSDALKFALAANTTHGLRRTTADKQYCVSIALKEFSDLSNRMLADLCAVSDVMIADMRTKVEVQESGTSESPKKRTGKDGKKYPSKKVKKAKSSPSTKDNVADTTPEPESESEPAPEQPPSLESKWRAAVGASEGWQPPEEETIPDASIDGEDSKTLAELKVLWMLATKQEKVVFFEWASAN